MTTKPRKKRRAAPKTTIKRGLRNRNIEDVVWGLAEDSVRTLLETDTSKFQQGDIIKLLRMLYLMEKEANSNLEKDEIDEMKEQLEGWLQEVG